MRKKIAVVLLLLVAIAAWFGYKEYSNMLNTSEELYSGTVEATLVPVQSELAGRLVKLNAFEGQGVRTGDILAQIDDQAAKLAVKSAESQLKQAQARLADLLGGTRAEEIRRMQANVEQARAGLEQIQAVHDQLAAAVKRDLENLQFAEKQLKDAQALFQEGTISTNELDAEKHKYNLAKTQYESSKAQFSGISAQYKSSKAQLKSAQSALDLALAGYTQPTIAAQKAAVEVAKTAVDMAKLNLAKTEIKSPIDGRVLYKHLENGQVVNPGARIYSLLNPREMWVTVYLPEAKLNKVEKGKKALVYVDAYPGKGFQGEVSFISDKAEFTPKNVQTKEERTTIVFAVKVRILEGSDMIKPGMPADVVFK